MKKHLVKRTENLLKPPNWFGADVTRPGGVKFRTDEHKFI